VLNRLAARRLVRSFAQSRRTSRQRLSPLDPSGIIASTLAGAPLRAIDVGAAGGIPAHWRPYLPYLEIDCFEPDRAECEARQRVSPANVRWFPVALAGTSERRRLHILNRATGSSLLPPNEPVILEYSGRSYAGVRCVVEVDCLSLSDFLARYQRPAPMLMKLDTQGTELEILSSLDHPQLDELLCVEVEVEFLELYEGQPTFGAVHAFMQEKGFRLLDLRTHRSYRNAGDRPNHYLRKHLNTASGSSALSAELVAGDALYIREPALQTPPLSKAALVRYLCILRMYRFYDLAFWLIEQAAKRDVITAGERDALARDLAHGAPRPRLWQRAGIAGSLARRIRWAFAYDDREVFWTRRSWPDQ
jgi:FkbM family methyltransferase